MRERVGLGNKLGEWPDWIHVEGRNCAAAGEFLRDSRRRGFGGRVSVDCERPREGLEELIAEADVVFLSEEYMLKVLGSAGRNAHIGLLQQTLRAVGSQMKDGAHGFLTLGKAGCYAFARHDGNEASGVGSIEMRTENRSEVRQRELRDLRMFMEGGVEYACFKVEALPLASQEVVETVGAGDTFIAGVIWAALRDANCGVLEQARMGVLLAGVKCTRKGFGGLWNDRRISQMGAGE